MVSLDHEHDVRNGVTFTRLQPGGVNGPHDEVLNDIPGGQVWQDSWILGDEDDAFRMGIPDIRMPPNQLWPLHWHDEWIAVVLLAGSALVGDWLMTRGDVLVSEANFEYGPVLVGPRGCQMLEVFAKNSHGGGYAPEYHDHPTLQRGDRVMLASGVTKPTGSQFHPRPAASAANAGNQIVPVAGATGLTVGRLSGGQTWDLGEPDDPARGVMIDTRLPPRGVIPVHWHGDWRWTLVLDGSMRIGDRELARDDIVIVAADAKIDAITVGDEGVHLLEFTRMAAGAGWIVDGTIDSAISDALAHVGVTLG